ncbi:MAG: hypothetical protein JW384_01717 [Nitrosomonadaceae bacterium]|nr:hypothetical protein [Nitrosomonadaceae bacterium]
MPPMVPEYNSEGESIGDVMISDEEYASRKQDSRRMEIDSVRASIDAIERQKTRPSVKGLAEIANRKKSINNFISTYGEAALPADLQAKLPGVRDYQPDQTTRALAASRDAERPKPEPFKPTITSRLGPVGKYSAIASAESGDPYLAFKEKFSEVFGRWPSSEEMFGANAIPFLASLRNEYAMLLPPEALKQFSLDRLSTFSNDFLAERLPDLIPLFSNERLLSFGSGISKWVNDPTRLTDLGFPPAAPPPTGGVGAPPPPPPTTAPPPTPLPGSTPKSPPVDIPGSHSWAIETGAGDWVRKQRADGVDWKDISVSKYREYTNQQWTARATDPRFKSIYQYAQKYYTQTGWWPSEVELNKFTGNMPNIPSIAPDGSSIIPKAEPGAATAGALEKWKVPSDADGVQQKLPPGYEWRFGSDGTPQPYDITPNDKDVMSGWYMNPQTGAWDYNPFAGAADYLQFNPANQQAWSDVIGGYIQRTGKLPNLEEARQLAIQIWAKSDPATMQRAQQFSAVNGFWPTPFELEFGAAKDKDANAAGSGTSGKAGLGQVPVFVPGIGVTLVQGSQVGAGGLMFDPFAGVPDSVRPWVREVLNGSLSIDQIPEVKGANGENIMRNWVNFALSKFQENIPLKMPSEIPWGQPGPNNTPPPTPLPRSVNDPLERGSFEDGWRQWGPPGAPVPSAAQLSDPSFVSQLDLRLIAKVPSDTLKRLPNDVLASLPNDVLINRLDLGALAKLPNERWTGEGKWKGSGFDSSIFLMLPNERLATFSKDFTDKMVTDRQRRIDLGLEVKEEPTITPPVGGTAGTGVPAAGVPGADGVVSPVGSVPDRVTGVADIARTPTPGTIAETPGSTGSTTTTPTSGVADPITGVTAPVIGTPNTTSGVTSPVSGVPSPGMPVVPGSTIKTEDELLKLPLLPTP